MRSKAYSINNRIVVVSTVIKRCHFMVRILITFGHVVKMAAMTLRTFAFHARDVIPIKWGFLFADG